MLKTFNCGLGMILIVNKNDTNKLFKISEKLKYKPIIIGNIEKTNSKSIIYEKN